MRKTTLVARAVSPEQVADRVRKSCKRTSLVAQWLRIHLPKEGV